VWWWGVTPPTVFVASNMPTNYPYKLQKPATVNQEVRETAETFIFDSGIGDDTTTRDVLETAREYNADYVIPCDELHNQAATTEAIREFVKQFDETHPSTPMLPLQPPHAEHYCSLPSELQDWFDVVCLGGMAIDEISDAQAIRWIESAARVIPDSKHIHALGIGGGIEFVRRVAGRGLIDSLDCSTPELAATFGSVLDGQLNQRQIRVGSGEDTRKRNTALAAFNSWQLADVWQREAESTTEQTTLGADA